MFHRLHSVDSNDTCSQKLMILGFFVAKFYVTFENYGNSQNFLINKGVNQLTLCTGRKINKLDMEKVYYTMYRQTTHAIRKLNRSKQKIEYIGFSSMLTLHNPESICYLKKICGNKFCILSRMLYVPGKNNICSTNYAMETEQTRCLQMSIV